MLAPIALHVLSLKTPNLLMTTPPTLIRPNWKLRGILEKVTSQGVVHRPFGSLKILSRIHKTKTVVKIILCFFHCVDIYTNGAKAVAGNTAGALAGIQAVASNCANIAVFFTRNKEKYLFHVTSLYEAVHMVNRITS